MYFRGKVPNSLARNSPEDMSQRMLNAGKMKADRVEKFDKLLALSEQYRRKNQAAHLNADMGLLVEDVAAARSGIFVDAHLFISITS